MKQGSNKPEGYLPRIADGVLGRMLDQIGAVEVAGTMWCGKTWTSLSYAASDVKLGRAQTRQAVEADPSIALIGAKPHLIDEWQDVPTVWDEVRDAVDADAGAKGGFILTGSSTPKKDKRSHSGAGRIARLAMRPMSLAESGESSGAVSLAALFEGVFEPCLVQQGLPLLAEAICRGGWPALVGSSAVRAEVYLDSYFDALFDVNIPKRGLNGEVARKYALSLARNLGSAATLKTLCADVGSAPARERHNVGEAASYLENLEDMYVIESVAGWDAPVRSKSRVRTKPKRYFADPSLAANLLQVTPERLLEDGQLFGVLFESLCMRDLAVYASALPHARRNSLLYYRDSDGLEVDAVIELRDGRWAAFEVKLGENGVPKAAKALNRLRRKVLANPAARNRAPEFMAVLVGAGEFARYLADEDVYVIPITALGA